MARVPIPPQWINHPVPFNNIRYGGFNKPARDSTIATLIKPTSDACLDSNDG